MPDDAHPRRGSHAHIPGWSQSRDALPLPHPRPPTFRNPGVAAVAKNGFAPCSRAAVTAGASVRIAIIAECVAVDGGGLVKNLKANRRYAVPICSVVFSSVDNSSKTLGGSGFAWMHTMHIETCCRLLFAWIESRRPSGSTSLSVVRHPIHNHGSIVALFTISVAY